jgi:tetratricopeptide (TPR) repeat protein
MSSTRPLLFLIAAIAILPIAGCSSSHDEGYAAREAVGGGNLLLWRATGGHLIEPSNIANPPEADAELHEEAMAEFDHAIELDPQNSDAYFARAMGHLYVDKYSAAIDDLSSAIERNPENAKAYYYRSLAYGASNQPNEAKKDLERATELEPTIAGGAAAEPTPG